MPPPKQHRNDPEPLMGAATPATAARILGEEEVEEMVASRQAETIDLDDVLAIDEGDVT